MAHSLATHAAALVTVLAIAVACGTTSASLSPAPTPATTATPAPIPTIAPAGSPSPAVTPTVAVTRDLAYETGNPYQSSGSELLDVYAPSGSGPWPVVVMLHGSPPTNTKLTLATQARGVAGLGFVVFMPSWGHNGSSAPDYDLLVYAGGQVACAIAFARVHAAEYGGDPGHMIIFGHSGGASLADVIAFSRPAPGPECPSGTTLGSIDDLVTWDADWLAIDPTWDSLLAADPRLFALYTPWQTIAQHSDLPVSMVTDEIVGPYVRDLSDPAVADAFFALRDPTGELRALIEQLGLLDDGKFDLVEEQRFADAFLERQGNPVRLDVMPGTTHDAMSAEGLQVLLGAFERLQSEP